MKKAISAILAVSMFTTFANGFQLTAWAETRSYIHSGRTDHTMFLTDENGLALQDYSYDGFGNAASFPPVPQVWNPYLATGEYYDSDAGLYDHRARTYSPQLGQFMSRDTYERSLGDLSNLPYGYNHPLNYGDPSGQSILIDVTLSMNLQTALSGLDAERSLLAKDWAVFVAESSVYGYHYASMNFITNQVYSFLGLMFVLVGVPLVGALAKPGLRLARTLGKNPRLAYNAVSDFLKNIGRGGRAARKNLVITHIEVQKPIQELEQLLEEAPLQIPIDDFRYYRNNKFARESVRKQTQFAADDLLTAYNTSNRELKALPHWENEKVGRDFLEALDNLAQRKNIDEITDLTDAELDTIGGQLAARQYFGDPILSTIPGTDKISGPWVISINKLHSGNLTNVPVGRNGAILQDPVITAIQGELIEIATHRYIVVQAQKSKILRKLDSAELNVLSETFGTFVHIKWIMKGGSGLRREILTQHSAKLAKAFTVADAYPSIVHKELTAICDLSQEDIALLRNLSHQV